MLSLAANAQMPRLTISANGRYLAVRDEYFPWIGDTGWAVLERLSREEIDEYLQTRKSQGFTVIQITLLSVNPGSMAPNAYGDTACIGNSITKPKVTVGNDPSDTLAYDFWDHADYFLAKASSKGLYVAVALMWGKDLPSDQEADAVRTFGEWVGNRYRNQNNIVWLTLGEGFPADDKNPAYEFAMAAIEGIRKGDTGNKLLTLHPHPKTGTSLAFHNLVDFNSWQSGQGFDPVLVNGMPIWEALMEDWNRKPIKPVADIEATYEGLPPYWEPDKPHRTAWHIRVRTYLSIFSGGFGHTYGANGVWDFQLHYPQLKWREQLQLEGAHDMKHLKNLLQHSNALLLSPDTTMVIAGQSAEYSKRVQASVAEDGRCALVYIADGHPVTLSLHVLRCQKVSAYWYNPRNGSYQSIGKIKTAIPQQFVPPGAEGPDNDWVLVVRANRFRVNKVHHSQGGLASE